VRTEMKHEHETKHEPAGYGVYFLTWFTLVVLTSITVTAAGMDFGNLSVFVALVIAAVKASVVLYLFMHLKYESKMFHIMVIVVLVTLVIFIGLTFTDTLFR
jgi:cytochrome c oxidase subunit 4